MKSPVRTWVVSATAIAGMVGGGVVAATAAGGKHPAATPTTPTTHTVADATAAADVVQLRSRVAALLAEEQRLRAATRLARHRLQAQVAHSQQAIRRSAAAAPAPPVAAPVVVAPRPATTHTTSGASGAQGSGDGEHEGGHDD